VVVKAPKPPSVRNFFIPSSWRAASYKEARSGPPACTASVRV
jgi:hypothetical protein